MNKKKLLASSTDTIRTLPNNLKKADEALFLHELRKTVKAVYLFTFHNIAVQSDGAVLLKKGVDLADEFYFYNNVQYLNYFSFFKLMLKQKLYNRYKIISKPVVFVADTWSYGYFHWMIEAIPRLTSAINEIKGFTVILPAAYKHLPFVAQSLKLLELDVFYMHKDYTYRIKQLMFSSHFCGTGNYSDAAIQKTRQIFRGTILNKTEAKKRIYISRKKAEKRIIQNEDELLVILNHYGFEIVYCENLNLPQQVALFSEAVILLANHGAGLSNMLFMPAGSAVIELRNENDNHNNCYFSLASALKLNYYYQLCKPINAAEDFHSADIFINAAEINELLKSVFDLKAANPPKKV